MLKKIILTFLLLFVFFQINLLADYITGEIVYLNNLKKSCGFKGNVMAKEYTQSDWEKFYEKGELNKAIREICPQANEIPQKHLDDIYQFFYKFAKDVPQKPIC